MSDCTHVSKAFFILARFSLSREIPAYSSHSTSLIKILTAKSHSHLLSVDVGAWLKSGRKLETPTAIIICFMMESCWGVESLCAGPPSTWWRGLVISLDGSKLKAMSSIFKSDIHVPFSEVVAGGGRHLLFSAWPKRVSIWKRTDNCIKRSHISGKYQWCKM